MQSRNGIAIDNLYVAHSVHRSVRAPDQSSEVIIIEKVFKKLHKTVDMHGHYCHNYAT